ncbi:hypothetical protein P167DRAFT_547214 [Morchella conica CCBAS932]|uniref:Uncharacterized protein n=1 Tax=Morchella conica CCBAS932 TaxID=1392247 RepID=A0A3N4KM29_9PEZI|nr:hypothetical protein P167DRAFT_547214 [Morchella conica CCBAS932]
MPILPTGAYVIYNEVSEMVLHAEYDAVDPDDSITLKVRDENRADLVGGALPGTWSWNMNYSLLAESIGAKQEMWCLDDDGEDDDGEDDDGEDDDGEPGVQIKLYQTDFGGGSSYVELHLAVEFTSYTTRLDIHQARCESKLEVPSAKNQVSSRLVRNWECSLQQDSKTNISEFTAPTCRDSEVKQQIKTSNVSREHIVSKPSLPAVRLLIIFSVRASMRFFVVTPEVRKSLNYNFLSYLSSKLEVEFNQRRRFDVGRTTGTPRATNPAAVGKPTPQRQRCM